METGEGKIALPAPGNPHWKGETGIGIWDNVPESGGEGAVAYHWLLYRQDTETIPEAGAEIYYRGDMTSDWEETVEAPTYEINFGNGLVENGYYYFAVSADGDGAAYADSPYVISDAFAYTGENAPPLPSPAGLFWNIVPGSNQGTQYYACWDNLDDYVEEESFEVCVYDESGDMVTKNIATKAQIMSLGHGGVWISPDYLEEGGDYRFVVGVKTARPNEYKSAVIPEPVPEEYFSPWLFGE